MNALKPFTILITLMTGLLSACSDQNASYGQTGSGNPNSEQGFSTNGDARQVADQFRQAPDNAGPDLRNAPDLSNLAAEPNSTP